MGREDYRDKWQFGRGVLKGGIGFRSRFHISKYLVILGEEGVRGEVTWIFSLNN